MYSQQPRKIAPPKPINDDPEVDLDQWDDIVADKYKVPKSLMKAVRSQESGGNVNAVSPTGVKGRYQVTERTAKSYGLDRNDPWQQSVAAAKHLRTLYDKTNGADDDERWLGSVAKYYGGDGAVNGDEVSSGSLDGVSNPAEHVKRVAMKWGEARRAESGQQPAAQSSPTPEKAYTYPKQYMGLETDPAKQKADKENWTRQFSTNYDMDAQPDSVAMQPRPKPLPRKLSTTTPNVFNKTLPQDRRAATQQAQQALDFRPAGGATFGVQQGADQVTNRVVDSPQTAQRMAAREKYQALDPLQRLGKRAAMKIQGATPQQIAEVARPVDDIDQARNALVGSAYRGIGNIVGGVPGMIRTSQPGIGSELARQVERVTTPIARRIGTASEVVAPTNPDDQSWLTNKIPAALGSAAPFIAGSMVTGGGAAAPAVLGALGSAGQFSEDVERSGRKLSPMRQAAGEGLAVATGLTEALGVGRALNKLGAAKPIAKRLIDPVEEGFQEWAQSNLEDINAAKVAGYDPNRQIDPLGPKSREAAALGAIVGGGMAAPSLPGDIRAQRGEAAVQREPLRPMGLTPTAMGPTARTSIVPQSKGQTEPLATNSRPLAPEVAPSDDAISAALMDDPELADVLNFAGIKKPAPKPESAPKPEVAARPAKPQFDAGAFRGELDNAKIEAGNAEKSNNWEAARDHYRSAMDTITEMQKEARRNKDAVALTELAREKSATNTNWQVAKRNAERAARQQVSAPQVPPTQQIKAPVLPDGDQLVNQLHSIPGNNQTIENATTRGLSAPLPDTVAKAPQSVGEITQPTADLTQKPQRSARPPKEAKRIISRIAEMGGINMDKHGGEMQSAKDARRVGLLRRKGLSPDLMAQQLRDEGYDVDPNDLNSLWSAIDRDVRGQERPLKDWNTEDLNRREGQSYGEWLEDKPPTAEIPAQMQSAPISTQVEKSLSASLVEPFQPDTADLAAVRDFGREEPQFTEEPPTGRLMPFQPDTADLREVREFGRRPKTGPIIEELPTGRLANLPPRAEAQTPSVSVEEMARVRPLFDSIKKTATDRGQSVATAVEDHIQQAGLFGDQLTPKQAEILRQMAGGKPREKRPAAQQDALLDIAPTLESRQAQRRESPLFSGLEDSPLFANAKPEESAKAPEKAQPAYSPEETAIRERESLPPIERRRALRDAVPRGQFGKLSEASYKRGDRESSLVEHPQLRRLLDLPAMPPYHLPDAPINPKTEQPYVNPEWQAAAQDTLNALAASSGKERSSQINFGQGDKGTRGEMGDLFVSVRKLAQQKGEKIDPALAAAFKGTVEGARTAQRGYQEFTVDERIDNIRNSLRGFIERGKLSRQENTSHRAAFREIATEYGISQNQADQLFAGTKTEATAAAERGRNRAAQPAAAVGGADGSRRVVGAGEQRTAGTIGKPVERATVSESFRTPIDSIKPVDSMESPFENVMSREDWGKVKGPDPHGNYSVTVFGAGEVKRIGKANAGGHDRSRQTRQRAKTFRSARTAQEYLDMEYAKAAKAGDIPNAPELMTLGKWTDNRGKVRSALGPVRLMPPAADDPPGLRLVQFLDQEGSGYVEQERIQSAIQTIQPQAPDVARDPSADRAAGETASKTRQLKEIAALEWSGDISAAEAKRRRDVVEQKADSPLSRAIGDSVSDETKVSAESLGLPSKNWRTPPSSAKPVRKSVNIDDVTLGRADLSKGRMRGVANALKGGVKSGRGIDPIQVVPDPDAPDKYVVSGDGNHRIAYLKLSGYKGNIHVTALEVPQKRASFGELKDEPKGPVSTMFGGQAILDSLRKGKRPSKPNTLPTNFNAQNWAKGALKELQNVQNDPAKYAALKATILDAQRSVQANNLRDFQDAVLRAKAITDDPATNWEKASAIRKAAMLSRPVSHLRNLLGNAAFQNLEEGARVPGSIADSMLGLVTNRRSLQGASVEDSARAIYAALTDGITAAKDAMAGRSNEDLAKALQVKEIHFNNRFVDKAVKTVFRSLGAEDQIFFTGAYDRAIREAAKLQARNEARQGVIGRKDMDARQKALLAAPTAQMEIDATLAAETAVFRNDNKLSTIISGAREHIGDKGNFALDLVLPFDRTPTNVVLRALEYSPIGAARGVVKGIRGSVRAIGARRSVGKTGTPTKADIQAAIDKAFTPAQQRSAAQLLGRGTAGTGLLALGYALASKGLMTGFYDEDDYKGEAYKRAAGAQPLAIKAGGRWWGLNGIGPIGIALGMGATMHDESKKKGGDIYGGAAKAAKEQILEAPLLSSAKDMGKDIGRVAKDRANAGKLVGNLAASFVPGIVGDVTQSIPYLRDSMEREVKDDPKKIKGVRRALREGAGQVGAKIPGVRRLLPVKKDITGQPVEARPLQAIDPFSSRSARPVGRRR